MVRLVTELQAVYQISTRVFFRDKMVACKWRWTTKGAHRMVLLSSIKVFRIGDGQTITK